MCGVREKRSGRQAARARDHVSDVGVVPVPGRRLQRGRDQGDRVAGPVGLLERGLERCRPPVRSPRPETVGPQGVRRVVRTLLRPGRREGRSDRRGGGVGHRAGRRSCAGGGCWRSTGSTSTCPTAKENAAEFGYAGSGDNRSAFPKARVVALAECGTHAFLAAEVDAYAVGEKTLAQRLYPRLRADELLTADRGFYSWQAWDTATATGAALVWRAPTQLDLPVRAGAARRHLPDRADQTDDPGPAPGAAAGRRPRRPGSVRHQHRPRRVRRARPAGHPPGPGGRVRRRPTGSATAPAS